MRVDGGRLVAAQDAIQRGAVEPCIQLNPRLLLARGEQAALGHPGQTQATSCRNRSLVIWSGHGDNAGKRARDPSDYVVSTLEVAGSTIDRAGNIAIEVAWKRKLLSRAINLNRN